MPERKKIKEAELKKDLQIMKKNKYNPDIDPDVYIKFLTQFNRIFNLKKKNSPALRGNCFKL
jgi:hypothetical protein